MRLLRFAETAHLATTLTKLAEHPIAGEVTREARGLMENLFSDRAAAVGHRVLDGIGSDHFPILCELVRRR